MQRSRMVRFLQSGPSPRRPINRQRSALLGTLDKFLARGLSDLAVSSDGKLVAYNHMLREGHDLMMIENFK